MRQGVCGETDGLFRQKDRQYAFEMGILRNGGFLSPTQPGRTEIQITPREQIRKSKSALDSRAPNRQDGLLHATEKNGVQYGEVFIGIMEEMGQAIRLTGATMRSELACFVNDWLWDAIPQNRS